MNEENLAAASDEPSAIVQGLPEPETTELPQFIRALRNPNFRLFWAGNFTSNIGTWMQNVAQGWLVGVTHTPESIRARPRAELSAEIGEAVETAQRLGAHVVGLGAFTSIVERGCGRSE